jgi:hypothetical protein
MGAGDGHLAWGRVRIYAMDGQVLARGMDMPVGR